MSTENTIAELEKTVSQIQDQLKAQAARARSTGRVIYLLGFLIAAVVIGSFMFNYPIIKEILQPRFIVNNLEEIFDAEIPKARKALQEEIEDSADDWAEDLSKELIANIPEGRKTLENFIVDGIEKSASDVRMVTGQEFRKFLQDNRETLKSGFESLKDKDASEKLVADLGKLMEDQMASDMKEQADELMYILVHLNSRLTKLKEGRDLDQEEAVEREVLMLARQLRDKAALEAPAVVEETPVAPSGN